MRRHFSLFYALVAAASLLCAAASTAASFVIDRIERGVAWAFDFIARTAQSVPSFGGLAFADGPAPSYRAPAVHSLRHEAGTGRRSAARNI